MMKWMECRATRREIDEGGEQLSAPALQHVASCAPCLAFQNERARLRELLTSLEPVTAPADFDFRLRARIAAQTEKPGPGSFFSGFALSTPAMAVAVSPAGKVSATMTVPLVGPPPMFDTVMVYALPVWPGMKVPS